MIKAFGILSSVILNPVEKVFPAKSVAVTMILFRV